MRRRSLLGALAAGGALAVAGPSLALAHPGGADDPRLVVVVLRGGLDGLAAVPAPGDPDYAASRGPLAASAGVVPLDTTFGLHPGLAPLLPRFRRGELLVVHATAPPYHDRSHFDAQDVLENGTARAYGASTGWLARALAATGSPRPAWAVGRQIPLLLRGPGRAASADPLREPRPPSAWRGAVQALYASDPQLGPALAEGLQMQALLARHQPASAPRRGPEATAHAVQTVARVLASEEGPRVAVLEMGGWDTHANQGPVLERQLGGLGAALAGFAEAMPAPAWRRTAVLVLTEFGRTVAGNGTGGSDHGVGGVALLLGGAIRGGRVLADWPGLGARARLEGRDLRPTTDLRSVLKGVLHDHLQVTDRALGEVVFPDSRPARRMTDLVRA